VPSWQFHYIQNIAQAIVEMTSVHSGLMEKLLLHLVTRIVSLDEEVSHLRRLFLHGVPLHGVPMKTYYSPMENKRFSYGKQTCFSWKTNVFLMANKRFHGKQTRFSWKTNAFLMENKRISHGKQTRFIWKTCYSLMKNKRVSRGKQTLFSWKI
jgi:hypothetical protein